MLQENCTKNNIAYLQLQLNIDCNLYNIILIRLQTLCTDLLVLHCFILNHFIHCILCDMMPKSVKYQETISSEIWKSGNSCGSH